MTNLIFIVLCLGVTTISIASDQNCKTQSKTRLSAHLGCEDSKEDKCIHLKDFGDKVHTIRLDPSFYLRVKSAELRKNLSEGIKLNRDGSVSKDNQFAYSYNIFITVGVSSSCWLKKSTQANVGKKLAIILNKKDLIFDAEILFPIEESTFQITIPEKETERKALKMCQEIYPKCKITEVSSLENK